MSQNTPQNHISKKRVAYTIPVDAVTVRKDMPYRTTDRGALTLDCYYPPDMSTDAPTPVVVFVTGFSDAGAQKRLGCTFKEMGSYVSWAQLVATSGLIAVTYMNSDPAADIHAVLGHIRENASSLGVDAKRIGLWSCSGNGPNALSVLMHERDHLRCAALLYPYTLDIGETTRIADGSRQFGFVNPAAGKSVDDLPVNVPLFLGRAGQDQMPGLNAALDQFVAAALARNLPLTVVNHAAGPHAFDLFDDSEMSREIVRQILAFFCRHL